MTENEFLLADRIQKIKSMNELYDLENNAYISFSGGKDSTVLHHLFDLALPGNKIPRLFINTNIEYIYIYQFVKRLSEHDDRIIILNSNINIKDMLNEVGYPFKSKRHSQKVYEYKLGYRNKSILQYFKIIEGGYEPCPNKLLYQIKDDFNLKISHKCCLELKKKPAIKWSKENQKPIKITGMLREEGGQRENINCILLDKDNNLKAFHPMSPLSKQWEDWFINEYKIKLCELYYPPYNFKRTGCKGCPFTLDLQDQLYTMACYLPEERKQCEIIWGKVYDEYRRIGYRLENTLF